MAPHREVKREGRLRGRGSRPERREWRRWGPHTPHEVVWGKLKIVVYTLAGYRYRRVTSCYKRKNKKHGCVARPKVYGRSARSLITVDTAHPGRENDSCADALRRRRLPPRSSRLLRRRRLRPRSFRLLLAFDELLFSSTADHYRMQILSLCCRSVPHAMLLEATAQFSIRQAANSDR